jgi:hypothetical protein
MGDRGKICEYKRLLIPEIGESIPEKPATTAQWRTGVTVTLKIEIVTANHQHLLEGTKGIIEGFDEDHIFATFNDETVAFRKDEVAEELFQARLNSREVDQWETEQVL